MLVKPVNVALAMGTLAGIRHFLACSGVSNDRHIEIFGYIVRLVVIR